MGCGPKGTYALQLNYWYKGGYQILVKIYCACVSADVLQIIEDDLSDKLEPAFGKRGGNGR